MTARISITSLLRVNYGLWVFTIIDRVRYASDHDAVDSHPVLQLRTLG